MDEPKPMEREFKLDNDDFISVIALKAVNKTRVFLVIIVTTFVGIALTFGVFSYNSLSTSVAKYDSLTKDLSRLKLEYQKSIDDLNQEANIDEFNIRSYG